MFAVGGRLSRLIAQQFVEQRAVAQHRLAQVLGVGLLTASATGDVVRDSVVVHHVRVVDGPFSAFNGVVDEVNSERGKVKVMVSIFGRATPVELDFLQVQPV